MTRFVDARDPGFLAVTADLVRWAKALPKPVEAGSEMNNLTTICSQLSISEPLTIPNFPYSRNADFVGCEAIIKDMHSTLQLSSRLALHGIGGVGKTEVAAEFCYRYYENNPKNLIFWIACDSCIKIDLAFRDIAIRLKLPGYDDPNTNHWDLAVQYLSSDQDRQWLMVLDNADDVELMTEGQNALAKLVRNFRNGAVIITTRDRYVARTIVGSKKSVVTVNSLSPEDASKLFRSKLPCDTKIDHAVELEVLDILEYLPLCITQAAAYLDQSEISISEYLLELTESETSLIEILDDEHVDLRRGFDTPNSVLRAWKLSFERIRHRCQQAAELLSVMAFLDRQDIPRSLLKDVIASRHQLNSALGTLQGFCLIRAEVDEKIFRMHRLVQLATKVWVRSEAAKYQASALRLVYNVFPGTESEDFELKRQLLPHGKKVETYVFNQDSLNMILAHLQFKLAAYEWHAGQYDPAAATCQFAYEKCKSILGELHIDTLRVAGLLGSIKASQGFWNEAYTIQSHTLRHKECLLGSEHLETIDTLSDLADVREKQGHFTEAEQLTQRAYRTRAAALGQCHRKTLQSLMNIATYKRRQARYEEAEKLGRQALCEYERTMGSDHILTLASGYALAGTLRESGQYKEAVVISKRVVEGRKGILGDDHPQTLLAINNLALGYRLDGDLQTAELLYRKVYAANQKLGRVNHPDSIQACQNLAVVLGDLGQFEEAESIGRDTLSRRRVVLGEEHLSTMNTAETLAINLEHRGKYSEAEALATEAYTIREKRLGASHAYTLDTLFVLGSIKEHTGRLMDAIIDFQKVRDGRSKVLGKDHPTTKATVLRLQRLGEE
ncbi:hypothetical protein SLS60_005765 [Paraconiothyrium brasiliense]|uniref:NB-ARC domain-containing protein n=1 Tax=Paraconiothyrium brasiliense TaxID=300254 RepID=A0ABR3RD21_9PLEO